LQSSGDRTPDNRNPYDFIIDRRANREQSTDWGFVVSVMLRNEFLRIADRDRDNFKRHTRVTFRLMPDR
jgi:hypothetical protein